MGLLDEFMAYMEANTPRSTRPAVSPLKVIDQGLLGSRIEQMPQRADEIKQGLLRVPADLKQLVSPQMNQQVQGAYANPGPEGFDREKGMQMAMDFLQTSTPVGGLAGMFIGKGAKTWDALAAQQADDLLAKGIDPRDVWKQTGTIKGVDGALRQEIPDNISPTKMDATVENLFFYPKAHEYIDHKPLFDAYPDTQMITMANGNIGTKGGAYLPKQNVIQLNAPYFNNKTLETNKGAHSTALHELQHAIQENEGWAKGGMPEQMAQEYSQARSRLHFLEKEPDYLEGSKQIDNLWNQAFSSNTMDEAAIASKEAEIIQQYPSLAEARKVMETLRQTDEYGFDAYKRLAGEAEARLTQSRMGLDAAQRLQHYPYDQGQYGLDVPLDSLIVRGLLNQ